MIYKRTIEKILKNLGKTFPVILITGPRQVGKSTILKEYAKNRYSYVSLDDYSLREQALKDPKLFLSKYELPIVIDEIQYAPNLMTYIKILVDEDRKNGMFWLTGSQKFELMKGVSESLAGRIAILDLLGLSQKELNKKSYEAIPFLPLKTYSKFKSTTVNALYKRIWRGSYPELYKNKNLDWGRFYSSYIQTYIERDIRNLAQVADERKFLTFLKILAARTGQLLNYNDVSKDIGVSLNTVKNWVSLLSSTGIIYLLQPYYSNITKRAIKTPKLYFLDTGLCAYLTGWETAKVLESGAMSGAFFETYVVSELIKSYWHNGKNLFNIYYYRDKDKKQIDLLTEANGMFYPIEIKKKSNPDFSDIKAFSILETFGKGVAAGAVLCLCDDWLPITDKVNAVNVGVI